MDLDAIIKKKYKERKKSFMEKSLEEKLLFLFEKLEDLEDEIEDVRNEEPYTNCSENEDEINKVKFEQICFLERIDRLENDVIDLEDNLKKAEIAIENLEEEVDLK